MTHRMHVLAGLALGFATLALGGLAPAPARADEPAMDVGGAVAAEVPAVETTLAWALEAYGATTMEVDEEPVAAAWLVAPSAAASGDTP